MLDKNKEPFSLFDEWYNLAKKKELNDPNAMNLATVDKQNKPHSRMVLLKEHSEDGFVFYTNLNSNKGKQIFQNPNVALNFHWKSMQRQIRIEGSVKKVEDSSADKYFSSRHYMSKIGAWASKQSSELASRKELESLIEYYKNTYKDQNKVPRPKYWTGLLVVPFSIEFWQDMPHRIHKRLLFQKNNGSWVNKSLYP